MDNQIQPIESFPLSQIVKEEYIAIDNKFKILTFDDGTAWGLIPTSRILTEEINLLKKPIISKYTLRINLLEGNNLFMFFSCAIRANEEDVKIMKGERK